jgi:large subunit ribosomal protein L29
MSLKPKRLRDMNREDLLKQLSELREEVFKERAAISTKGSPKNTKAIRTLKRDITRILNVLSQKSGA